MKVGAWGLAGLLLLATLSCEPGRPVSAASFPGDPWPLSVSDGILRCRPPSAVTFEARGVEYGVNGTALAMDYPRINPIWLDDPDPERRELGLKVSVNPLIQAGLDLCDAAP